MKTRSVVALSMFAGCAIGAVAVQGLHAQTKAPVYLVSEITVTDPEGYGKEYSPKVQATIAAAGGRLVALGGVGGGGAQTLKALQGDRPQRVAIQLWPSMEKVEAWFNSEQYKEARKIGDKYAKFRVFVVEGRPQ